MGSLHNADVGVGVGVGVGVWVCVCACVCVCVGWGGRQKHNAEGGREVKKFKNYCSKVISCSFS